jgi:hypothetical protein
MDAQVIKYRTRTYLIVFDRGLKALEDVSVCGIYGIVRLDGRGDDNVQC